MKRRLFREHMKYYYKLVCIDNFLDCHCITYDASASNSNTAKSDIAQNSDILFTAVMNIPIKRFTITFTAEFYVAPPTKWTGALNNKSYAYE